jgi:hypothetical protein
MSDAASRLPARPSLEQLRKRAKERLETLRATLPSATLADAQYALARDYGFDSWPKLVHHIEAVVSSARTEQFDRVARDIRAGYLGDVEALQRLIAHYGVGYNPEQFRIRVQSRVNDSRGTVAGQPSLTDIQHMLAHDYGFDSWAALTDALAQPADSAPDPRLGLSSAPPFYRLDAARNTIEIHPPVTDADWDAIFALMRDRGVTGIETAAITDSAMARLSRLEFVTTLNLRGPALSDDGLLHLARMPQLEEVSLGGALTDRGMAVLGRLPRLRRFAACWMKEVTDAGVANLGSCDELESVDLMGTPTGDGALAALGGKARLRHLKTGRLVTDAGLAFLHDLPVFKSWSGGDAKCDLMTFAPEPNSLLLDGPFTDRGLASLQGLDGAFGVGFFWHAHQFTGEGLAALASLPNLGFLGCQGERCDDAAMRSIATFPALRMLMAQGTVASDDGFAALSRSTSLEYLWGRECPNLRGRGFAALAAMPALVGLGVSCKYVDERSLAALPDFPALRQLMPMDVTNAGFRHIGRCHGLVDLWCMYCRDTGDEATGHIAGLKLKTYYAGKTKITDKSLEILGRMTSLELVELWETAGVSDAGLVWLAKLPRLRQFTITGAPRVTRQALSVFPPSVRVSYWS